MPRLQRKEVAGELGDVVSAKRFRMRRSLRVRTTITRDNAMECPRRRTIWVRSVCRARHLTSFVRHRIRLGIVFCAL